MSNNRKKNEIPWFAIIACFVLGVWPVGIFLLIMKINQESKSGQDWTNTEGYRRAQNASRSFEQKFGSTMSDVVNSAVNDVKSELRREAEGLRGSFRQSTQGEYTAQEQHDRQSQPEARSAGEPAHDPRSQSTSYADIERERQRRRQQAQQPSYQSQNQQRRKQAVQDARRESERAARENRATEERNNKFKSRMRGASKIKSGKGWVIAGIIVALIFGFAAVDELLLWLPGYPLMALREMLFPAAFAGAGVGMFIWGRFRNKQARQFRKILNLLGEHDTIDIQTLAEAMPCSYEHACETIQSMIDQNILESPAYIDAARGELILNGAGLKRKAAEPKPAVSQDTTEDERSILEEIRQVNASITDPVLSRKINRIEEITGHILDYQTKHPEKAVELHKFLDYYLPTTLKILKTYAELDRQGVDTDNISTTKERIEGMMDMVVEGFENQLDKLFAGDMMDISSDISVMEKMMNTDGLAGGIKMPKTDDGIQLTLEPEPFPSASAPAAPSAPDLAADGWTSAPSVPSPDYSGIQLTLSPNEEANSEFGIRNSEF